MYDFSCTGPLDLLHVRGYDLLVEEAALHIRDKDINKLARNHPVAVIIGAAGFIGSHLADHLLKLKIQVIGIDDMSCGNVHNLFFANKSSNFYFEKLKVEDQEVANVLNKLPRLDYAFFMAQNDLSQTLPSKGLESFLEVINFHHQKQIREHQSDSQKPKLLFLSSVELYDNKHSPRLKQLENAEIFFAKFAGKNGLNARVIRLGEVFGPRMDLDQPEIFSRLIRAALNNALVKENPTQDFSTRGIYIDDAVNLITKGMLLGASANKIFDGVQVSPLKVEEVKQVLLNPDWFQNSDFKFTQLPPWETPNLKRTIKELSWRPNSNIIISLKETLEYFSRHPSALKSAGEPNFLESDDELILNEKIEPKEPPKAVSGWSFKEVGEDEKTEDQVRVGGSIWPVFKFLVIWIIILLGLIYPLFILIAGSFIIPNSLKKAEGELIRGDFKNASEEISLGYLSAKEQDNIISPLAFLQTVGMSNQYFEDWRTISQENVATFQNVQKSLNLIEKFTSDLEKGTLTEDSAKQLIQIENEVEQNLANSLVKISATNKNILGKVDPQSLQDFYQFLRQTRTAEEILPGLLASSGGGKGSQVTKQYLVILQDNQTSRPTGGVISGLVLVKVGNGKVVDISTLSLDDLDKKLPTNLVPEDLIKVNLNISNLKISNSNFDADFPTFAKTFEALYLQSGGGQVDGVISVDTRATGKLIESFGGLSLDSGEKITTSKEVEVIINGSDPIKKNEILKQLMLKIFGISGQNIFKVGQNLSESLKQKDIIVFVNDSNLENRFINNNWSGMLGALKGANGDINDFISASIYDFGLSTLLKKEWSDQVIVDEQGTIQHNLTINFIEYGNKAFNGEIMIYLPVGVKINKASIGSQDLSQKVSSFIKYGLSGISSPLSIKPNENQKLVLSYQLPGRLNLGQGSGSYKYQILKQPGTSSDPAVVTFNYPEDIKVSNNLNPNETVGSGQKIQTDLSVDPQFQLTFITD